MLTPGITGVAQSSQVTSDVAKSGKNVILLRGGSNLVYMVSLLDIVSMMCVHYIYPSKKYFLGVGGNLVDVVSIIFIRVR